MKMFLVDRWIIVSTAFFCFFAAKHCLVRGEKPKKIRLVDGVAGPEESIETDECRSGSVVLEVTRDKRVFQFKCAQGSKLHPVEKDTGETDLQAAHLKKVYEFAAGDKSGPTCGATTGNLSELVPNSALTVVHDGRARVGLGEQASQTVFKLTLGDAPDDEKHLCYTCVTPGEAGSLGRTAGCTIYATVPQKEKPKPQEPPQEPGEEVTPPEESGFYSPSASLWLASSVAGCLSALMLLL